MNSPSGLTTTAAIDPSSVLRASDTGVSEAERDAKLLRYIAGSVSLVDVDGHIVATSGRYRPAFGYSASFWESHSILDILVPEDLSRVLAMRETILAEPGAGITAEVQIRRARGTIETLEVTAVNLLHDPDLAGVVLTTREITADHDQRAALSAVRDDALAEAEQRSHLLALVSQRLRNPLNAIAELSRTLADEHDLSGRDRELARSIHEQIAELASSTEELLATARVDGGGDELDLGPTDVSALVDDAARFARQGARTGVMVEAIVDESMPDLILADPTRLQQVLASLVSNAAAFTYAGSITIRALIDNDSLALSVIDTGSGIPEHEVQLIFDPFTTSATATSGTGTGLGLAIVSRLVAAMSGRIEVDSTVGRGSTFTITLPLTPFDPAVAPATPASERETDIDASRPVAPDHGVDADRRVEASGSGVPTTDGATDDDPAANEAGGESAERETDQRARILVVEDTVVNQVLARHQLERIGMDSVIAETAEAGLSMLEDERFDAVLMDHQLPGMNGREATRELRRRGDQTPVVGLTASATAADRNKSLEAGMNQFLAKPAGIDELGSALHEVLGSTKTDPSSTGSTSTESNSSESTSTGSSSTGSSDTDSSEAESETADHTTDHRASAEPAVRFATLDELADELGDRSVVEALVTTFVTELDGRRGDIVGPDEDLASRQAHTLKASARLLGADRLADACELAHSDPANRAELSDHADDARDALVEWLGSPPKETTS